jgi:hypothetical protein
LEYNYEIDDNGVLESYEAMRDGGFELYHHACEDGNFSPSYFDEIDEQQQGTSSGKERYALVRARSLDVLCRASDGFIPRFCEIFSEPDGGRYTGPYATPTERLDWLDFLSNGTDWSRDFAAMYKAVFESLQDTFDRWIDEGIIVPEDRPRLGGHGYLAAAAEGLNEWVDMAQGSMIPPGWLETDQIAQPSAEVFALLAELVRDADEDYFDFVSVHWYGRVETQYAMAGYDQDEVGLYKAAGLPEYLSPEYLTPGVMLLQLVKICRGLRRTFEHFGRECPPIQVSEYHYSLPEQSGPPTYGNFGGMYVSAALTWMQHRLFGIDRAHLFAGHDPMTGIFPCGKDLKELFDEFEPRGQETRFGIRRGAMAMALHAGIEDWLRVIPEAPVTDVDYVPYYDDDDPRAEVFDGDVLEELRDADELLYQTVMGRMGIAVLAARRSVASRDKVLIVTNLDDEVKDVTVRMESMQDGVSYRIERTTLGEFPDNGKYPTDPEDDDYVDPMARRLSHCLPVPARSGDGSRDDPYIPDQSWIDFWFGLFLPRSGGEDQYQSSGGRLDYVIERMPAYGVVRLDISGQGEVTTASAQGFADLSEPITSGEALPPEGFTLPIDRDVTAPHTTSSWIEAASPLADILDFRVIADQLGLTGVETPADLFTVLDLAHPGELIDILESGPLPGLMDQLAARRGSE